MEQQENCHPNRAQQPQTVNNIIINNYHGGVLQESRQHPKSFNPQAASFYPFFPQEQRQGFPFEQDDQEQLRKKSSGGKQPPNFNFPDGGWVCSSCQNYNFMGRVKCNRCQKQKSKTDFNGKPKHLLKKPNTEGEEEPQTSEEEPRKVLTERAGDWVCQHCRNLNFSFRKMCNRCSLARSQQPGPPGVVLQSEPFP